MSSPSSRFFLFAAAISVALCSSATAHDVLLTMDDLPTQPVHGLAHPSGVEFGFTVGGVGNNDATYNSFGPGPITYVQDPSIEGTSEGILFVNLPEPASLVRFGLARSISTASSATVELFDASNVSLGARGMRLVPSPTFAEGQFQHQGQAVSRFTVSFPGTLTRFAFDNLFFQVIPEPTSLALAASGIGMVVLGRRRSRVFPRS